MKRNTSKLIISALGFAALLFTTQVNAQTETKGDSKDVRLGLGLSVGIPTNDAYNIAVGGDLRLQKDFYSNVSGILSLGYTNFSIKDALGGGSIGFLPLKVGVKVFPMERVYFSGELGAAFGTDKGQETSFVYAPGVGIGFNNGLDLGLRYEGLSNNGVNLGQVALRLAYGFNLSR
ncbi:MAG: hypothetical protein H7Y07_08705 [Pyrinomonadaceae bacterium]|nr:hypothetical protein [Sphingobacteriaceae bacterium]